MYRQGREATAKRAKAPCHTIDKHSSTIYRGEALQGGIHILLDKHSGLAQTAGKFCVRVMLYCTTIRPQKAKTRIHTLRLTRVLLC